MLVRVFQMPEFGGGFRFGGGKHEVFLEVDWFRSDGPDAPSFETAEGRAAITEFLKAKRYFKPGDAYLVLHPMHPFCIGYEAP